MELSQLSLYMALLGFRRSLAYLHLSAASPPSSVAIGGNCVCSIFAILYCTGQAARSLSHGGIEYRSHNRTFLRDVSWKLERERLRLLS